MWQEIIVGILVMTAFIYLLRPWLPFGKKAASGCSGCGSGCSSTKSCDSPTKNSSE